MNIRRVRRLRFVCCVISSLKRVRPYDGFIRVFMCIHTCQGNRTKDTVAIEWKNRRTKETCKSSFAVGA